MKRRGAVAFVGAAIAAALPAMAAAVMLWTLVATPLTTTANQSTTFNLTATNLDPLTDLGCIEVDVPSSFVVESAGTSTASNGATWVAWPNGNVVFVRSLSGGGRLKIGQSVQFTIRARATAAGAFLWPNHAHNKQDCTGEDQAGVPLTVTVLPQVLPTPTPTATPAPTSVPTATPKPAPTATPIVPLPSLPLPSVPALPTPRPTPGPVDSPTASSAASAAAEPSRSPAASEGTGAIGSDPPLTGSTGASGAGGVTLARGLEDGSADLRVGVELLGLLDGEIVWFVPAASVALPGLLVILWVVLQAMGALAWIPAVRRMSDESGDRGSRPA